ncbi:hypothetical protein [Pedobacter psychrotolerans]|uniref:hypothetical protein n=1 Tax=Pedobacter psychrotolerans TaxID=1843235 RepID=UPI003F948F16
MERIWNFTLEIANSDLNYLYSKIKTSLPISYVLKNKDENSHQTENLSIKHNKIMIIPEIISYYFNKSSLIT